MKSILCVACFAVVASAASGAVSGCGVGRTVIFEPGRTEVVLADGAPGAAAFAASEATNFLSRVLGAEVPVVSRPTGKGIASLILGSNAWSVAAGVLSDGSVRDGFRIRAVRDRVYIVGNDDDVDVFGLMRRGAYNARFRSGTLFGVYEFLERFAGVRFYFPGEKGRFFDRLEKLWIGKVAIPSVIGETEIGPVMITGPSERDLWAKIYTPNVIAELGRHLDRAAKLASADSMASKRIAWICAGFYGTLLEASSGWSRQFGGFAAANGTAQGGQ